MLILAAFSLIVSVNASRAQCPFTPCDPCPTDVPPRSVSWTSGFQDMMLTVNGHWCYVNIRDLDPQELRRRVAIVLQDAFLFSADIATNISLGNEGISEEEVVR